MPGIPYLIYIQTEIVKEKFSFLCLVEMFVSLLWKLKCYLLERFGFEFLLLIFFLEIFPTRLFTYLWSAVGNWLYSVFYSLQEACHFGLNPLL